MALEIRFATADDSETVHRFISELAAYEREPDAVEATPESLRRQLGSPRPPFECLIAEERGEAVGFALFFHNYSTWRGRPGLFVEDIFVPPPLRGGGVGTALFRELARVARDRGCARMEWMVLDWNDTAVGFYEKIGARPLDEWTVFRLTGAALEKL
jgi:GNAT superfamily N-acetyltransferase